MTPVSVTPRKDRACYTARWCRAPSLAFASPRKLPHARDLKGRVVVLDVAFASEAASGGFDKTTLPFIEGLGPRLVRWVDHHDHVKHEEYRRDPRFVLATKAEHGACPEMVTPELVVADRAGGHHRLPHRLRRPVQRGQVDPRRRRALPRRRRRRARHRHAHRQPGPIGAAVRPRLAGPAPRHRALRAHRPAPGRTACATPRSGAPSTPRPPSSTPIEEPTRKIAAGYRARRSEARRGSSTRRGALGRVRRRHRPPRQVRQTQLLLIGQERASLAIVVDTDNVTFAARYGSGVSFLDLLGLSGGMPTLVSIPRKRLVEALGQLGTSAADIQRLVG